MKIHDPMTGATKDKSVTRLTPTGEEGATMPTPPADEGLPPLTSASSYAERIKQKQLMRQLKENKVPLGGAPPIPPGKLAPIAEAARAMQQGGMAKPFYQMPDKLPDVPENFVPAPAPVRRSQPPPEEPLPPHLQGMGSAYAVNQHLAEGGRMMSMAEANREGLMKSTGKPQVSPETQQLIEHMGQKIQEANRNPQPGPTAAATPSKQVELDEAEKTVAEDNQRKVDDVFPVFPDFQAITEAQRLMMGPERRKAIEGRLKPLNFGDLLQKGEIQQECEIIPDQYHLTLRTVSQREHFFCMQYIYEQTGSLEYTQQLLYFSKVVCSIVAQNGSMLPDHRKNIGTPQEAVDKDSFIHKSNIICRMPIIVVADMGIQYDWFCDRVARLFSFEKLKNG